MNTTDLTGMSGCCASSLAAAGLSAPSVGMMSAKLTRLSCGAHQQKRRLPLAHLPQHRAHQRRCGKIDTTRMHEPDRDCAAPHTARGSEEKLSVFCAFCSVFGSDVARAHLAVAPKVQHAEARLPGVPPDVKRHLPQVAAGKVPAEEHHKGYVNWSKVIEGDLETGTIGRTASKALASGPNAVSSRSRANSPQRRGRDATPGDQRPQHSHLQCGHGSLQVVGSLMSLFVKVTW